LVIEKSENKLYLLIQFDMEQVQTLKLLRVPHR